MPNLPFRRFLPLAAAVIILGLVGVGCSDPPPKPTTDPGTVEFRPYPAPRLSGILLDGRPLSSNDLKGKPLVVYFWASWCPPCKSLQPDINALHAEYGDKVRFLGVDWRDERVPASDYARKQKLAHSVVFDPDGKTGFIFGVRALPDMYFISSEGVVTCRLAGSRSKKVMASALEQIISPGATGKDLRSLCGSRIVGTVHTD